MKKHGMTLCRGCNFERGAVQRLRYLIGCHTFGNPFPKTMEAAQKAFLSKSEGQ